MAKELTNRGKGREITEHSLKFLGDWAGMKTSLHIILISAQQRESIRHPLLPNFNKCYNPETHPTTRALDAAAAIQNPATAPGVKQSTTKSGWLAKQISRELRGQLDESCQIPIALLQFCLEMPLGIDPHSREFREVVCVFFPPFANEQNILWHKRGKHERSDHQTTNVLNLYSFLSEGNNRQKRFFQVLNPQ